MGGKCLQTEEEERSQILARYSNGTRSKMYMY